jgi:hypothetical protein
MNLNNFESNIKPIILERGYDYYEIGAVTSLKETDENIFEAEVNGTDIYTVDVELDDNGDITYTMCDCPYNMGEYCKHQVAVFMTLRDLKGGKTGWEHDGKQKKRTSFTEIKQTSNAKQRPATDIRQLLSGRTNEELINLLVGITSEYEEVRRRIELSFNAGNEKDELKKSIALIRSYINKYSESDDFVDYYDTPSAVKGAEIVLDSARHTAEIDNAGHAVDMALCVIHEMIDLLEHADDSDGIIGNVIYGGLSLIDAIISDEKLTDACKNSIFDKLLKEAMSPLYDGWTDWRLDLLRCCSRLADEPELRGRLEDRLFSMVKAEKEDADGDDYFTEHVNLIRYGMVNKFDDQGKAREFIKQNLRYSGFRKIAIEAALREQDFEEAVRITKDGEEHDQDKAGLVDQWREYRYKAYSLMGKLDELRELAVVLILGGRFEYYHELKNTYDSSEWPEVYHGIILRLEEQQKTYQPVYTEILIEEREKEKLLEYVKQDVSRVTRFYKHLIPEYRDIVYEMFRQYIEYCAKRANSRNGYKGVCAIIRNLKKAGGKAQATEIKQALIEEYPRRPALRDELSKV